MTNFRPALRWLGWSPVAAVLWAALAMSAAGGLRGCDSVAGPDRPKPAPYLPPNPPPPPEPTPNPMGRGEVKWEWFPMDRGSDLAGWWALCRRVDGDLLMKELSRTRPR